MIHRRSPSFRWSVSVVTCIATGAFWSCSSNDASPMSQYRDAGLIEPPVFDACTQDTGADTSVEPKKLSVVAMSPANGDTNVSVRDPIQVTFSDPVQIGTSPITLATPDGKSIPTTFELSTDQHTITVWPVTAQAAPAEVVAHFGDVSTLDGKLLASKPDWTWKLPAWLRVGSDLKKRFSLVDSSLSTGPGRRITLVTPEWTTGGNLMGVVSTVDTLHGTWTQLGGYLPSVTWGSHMLLDPNGNIVLTSFYDDNILVQRWSGTGWDILGGPIPDGAGDVYNSPIAIDAKGKLFVAYSQKRPDDPTMYDLIVRSFEGKDHWSPVGGPVSDSMIGSTFDPNVAVDPAGVPYVAYTDPWANIRKWTGSTWMPVGSKLSPTPGYARWLQVAFDDGGHLFAIGDFANDTSSVITSRVIRFDGTDWVFVGDSLGSKFYANPLVVAGYDGHVFAVVRDDDPADTSRVVDITATGWTKSDWPIEGSVNAITVTRDNVPLVTAAKFGVLRLNR